MSMNGLLPTGLRHLLLRSLKIAKRVSGGVPVAYYLAGIIWQVNLHINNLHLIGCDSIGIAPFAFGEMVLA